MKGFFIITNALNTKHSVLDTELRLNQLLDTIASVRCYAPSSTICLLEMSAIPLDEAQINILDSKVDHFFGFSWDEEVQRIYHDEGIHTVKNLTETLCLKSFFLHLQQSGLANGYDRVFKLSGRYVLTEIFDVQHYKSESLNHKYVFAKARSPAQYVTCKDINAQYMSRLWSFDVSLLDKTCQIYSDIYSFMTHHRIQLGYVDIEHALYHHIPKETIVEFDKVGVMGVGGYTGSVFED